MKNIVYYEFLQFFRNKISWISFLLFSIIGIYAIYHGQNTIDQQLSTIDSLEKIQQHNLEENMLHQGDKDVGWLCYYQFYYTNNSPSEWASFSIGQRDLNAYSLPVRMLAIQGQLYDSELTNPVSLLIGNIDLSFVFTFLLPLLIIAMTFNILSSEKEDGVWRMVASQTAYLKRLLFIKYFVRYVFVVGLTLFLFIIASFYLQLSYDFVWVKMFLYTIMYLTFWFVVSILIVGLDKNTGVNAVSMLSAWLLMVIILPAMVNLFLAYSIPIPEALETTVNQRQAYHEKWDMPKDVVMEPFYADYPQYKHYEIPEEEFTWAWYYAMMKAADTESSANSNAFFGKLEKRVKWGEQISYFIPSLFLQNQYNSIAKSDLRNHINYLHSVKEYHQQLSEFFYPYIFDQKTAKEVEWDKLPVYSNEYLMPIPVDTN